MRIVRCALAIAALAAAALPAMAANLWAINEMPIRYMTEEDRSIFRAKAVEVLERGKAGDSDAWENPKTGARGTLQVRDAYDDDGRACRDIEVANSAGGRSNRLVLTVCRDDDGNWKVQAD